MTRPAPWLKCAATIAVPRARFPILPRTAYAVIVAGGGLLPAYRDGETLIVDPLRPPRDGDVVVIWPAEDGRPPELRRRPVMHVVIGALQARGGER